jgi:hypothetical protein
VWCKFIMPMKMLQGSVGNHSLPFTARALHWNSGQEMSHRNLCPTFYFILGLHVDLLIAFQENSQIIKQFQVRFHMESKC